MAKSGQIKQSVSATFTKIQRDYCTCIQATGHPSLPYRVALLSGGCAHVLDDLNDTEKAQGIGNMANISDGCGELYFQKMRVVERDLICVKSTQLGLAVCRDGLCNTCLWP